MMQERPLGFIITPDDLISALEKSSLNSLNEAILIPNFRITKHICSESGLKKNNLFDVDNVLASVTLRVQIT